MTVLLGRLALKSINSGILHKQLSFVMGATSVLMHLRPIIPKLTFVTAQDFAVLPAAADHLPTGQFTPSDTVSTITGSREACQCSRQ